MSEDQYQDIPKEFYSFETNQPFENCVECEKYLLDDSDYIIEKAMKQYPGYDATDTVFDYAICMDCALRMREEFSEKSLKNVDNYFGKNVNKLTTPQSEKDLDMDDCLGKCVIKDHHKSELNEYQIYAYCRGNKLFKGIPPYMVSGHAIDEILPLLSNETIDFLNGFYNKHFSPDPTMMEPDPRLVFI